MKEVTAVFVREIDHINYLTIEDENGNIQTFEVTDAHPFWVVTDEPDLDRAARGTVDENGNILYHENIESGLNGFWVEAKDLREGDVFLGANGELLTFVSNERIELDESIKVYNFTVADNHNYFVIAATDEDGQTCVLVHNAGSWGEWWKDCKAVFKETWSTVVSGIVNGFARGALGFRIGFPIDPVMPFHVVKAAYYLNELKEHATHRINVLDAINQAQLTGPSSTIGSGGAIGGGGGAINGGSSTIGGGFGGGSNTIGGGVTGGGGTIGGNNVPKESYSWWQPGDSIGDGTKPLPPRQGRFPRGAGTND